MTTAQVTAGAFAELAAAHGVQLSYQGTDGWQHQPDDAVVLAILQALGVPIDSVGQAADIVHEHRVATVARPLEPVLVHRTGRLDRTGSTSAPVVTLPSRVHPRDVWCTVTGEEGAVRRWPLSASILGMGEQHVAGSRWKQYRLSLEPDGREAPLAPGYHRFDVEWPGASSSALLISAPVCPRSPRGWGAFLPLHALRTDDDWGLGSYSDMADLGRWVDELGGSLLGALPLYPAFLDPPADPSPYLPVSRLAYNEVFIDPTAVAELQATPEARRLLESGAFRERIATAHHSALVDYEAVSHLRRQVLEPMAAALEEQPSSRRDEFFAFVEAHPELGAYARFRAWGDRHGHRSGAAAQLPASDAEAGPTVGYHLYTQWLAAGQLASAAEATPLYADLPIGVHPDGFDPLWSPRSFVRDIHGGAPPDLFFAGGQDWAFPPLHPTQLREDGYGYFINVLRRAFRHAAFLRIDHIMGLQRLYWIPEGFGAQHGAYVSYRADELHAVVSLEAYRAGAVVVGEDLGTVPDGVRTRMAADHMLRSWVLQFESTASDPLPDPPAGMLASWATHDLPRFPAYLSGEDIDEQEAKGQLAAEDASAARTGRAHWRRALLRAIGLPESADSADSADRADRADSADSASSDAVAACALRACLAHLAASAADLVLVDLEDLWGEHQPQNRPGTGTEAGNWRQRAAHTLAETRRDAGLADFLRQLGVLRRGTPVEPTRTSTTAPVTSAVPGAPAQPAAPGAAAPPGALQIPQEAAVAP